MQSPVRYKLMGGGASSLYRINVGTLTVKSVTSMAGQINHIVAQEASTFREAVVVVGHLDGVTCLNVRMSKVLWHYPTQSQVVRVAIGSNGTVAALSDKSIFLFRVGYLRF